MTLPAWVSYVACDFTASDYEATLSRSLEALGFRRDRQAFIVWEGVTTYLGVAGTDRTLRFLAALCVSGTRVVFDVGSRFFDPETVFDHATRAGFSSCEAHSGDALWRRRSSAWPLRTGSCLAFDWPTLCAEKRERELESVVVATGEHLASR